MSRAQAGQNGKAAVFDLGKPNPKQVTFFKARERFIAYGGARGGGKSWAVRKKAAGLCLVYAGIRVLVLRRSYPELRENHVLPMQMDLAALIRAKVCTYKTEENALVWQNGSRILFGYCDKEADLLRYQGQEFDVIFLDEATQLTEFQFQVLTACLRGANNAPKRFYLTCNPGGVGHAWVKRLFVDRDFRNEERPEDYRFIPATVYDNDALMEADPGYLKMLQNLPEQLRKGWLEGEWDLYDGQFFAEWRREVHVCAPFEIPAHWRRYVALDYGMDMLAALWIALAPDGRAWVYREVYEGRDNRKGADGKGHIVSAAARRLLEATPAGETVYSWLAPPDMWNRNRDTGRSTADIFAEHGIRLERASNDRVAGWRAVREWLAPMEDEQDGQKSGFSSDGPQNEQSEFWARETRLPGGAGATGRPVCAANAGHKARQVPGLQVFATCPNLIRTLPALQFDERNPEDAAGEPHELTHAPDALRAFCVSWTAPAAAEKARERTILDEFKLQPAGDPLGKGDEIHVI